MASLMHVDLDSPVPWYMYISGREDLASFMQDLNAHGPWLTCAMIHVSFRQRIPGFLHAGSWCMWTLIHLCHYTCIFQAENTWLHSCRVVMHVDLLWFTNATSVIVNLRRRRTEIGIYLSTTLKTCMWSNTVPCVNTQPHGANTSRNTSQNIDVSIGLYP